jgi:ABC-type spermidine/putrescine transport system permease subunit II
VSGTRAATLPKQMWDGIRTEIDPTIAAVSSLLIAVTALVMSALVVARRPR